MNRRYAFPCVGSSGATSRCPPPHMTVDTIHPTLYTDSVSVHPMLKDSSPKPYCLLLRDHRMNRCSTVGSSSATTPVLACLCLIQIGSPDRLMVPSNGLSVHLTLLTSLLILYNSFGASRKWIVDSSDSAS
jgi:hypothetical protein